MAGGRRGLERREQMDGEDSLLLCALKVCATKQAALVYESEYSVWDIRKCGRIAPSVQLLIMLSNAIKASDLGVSRSLVANGCKLRMML